MSLIDDVVREVLMEDAAGFQQRTDGMKYSSHSSTLTPYSTFDKPDEKSKKNMARQIKTTWKEEADHSFFDSLTKIHWISPTRNHEKIIRRVTGRQNKDEISVILYDETESPDDDWGNVGLQVEGHVTLAANDMNSLYTGYSNLPQEIRNKFKNSGVPKRPLVFNKKTSAGYILDAGSYTKSQWKTNEGLVANWYVVAIRFMEGAVWMHEAWWSQLISVANELRLPVYDKNDTQIKSYDDVKVLRHAVGNL